MDGTLKWRVEGHVVVQGERHQRSLAIRVEDTGHVRKLCVKTLCISGNYHSQFCSFLCIVRNYNILHSQDVGKTGVYASHCFFIHLPGGGQCPLVRDSEPIRLLEIPTSPSLYMLISLFDTSQRQKFSKRRSISCSTSWSDHLLVHLLAFLDFLPNV